MTVKKQNDILHNNTDGSKKMIKDNTPVLTKNAIPNHRDQTLDILKGIGIILMVVGHSGAPVWLHHTIYSFHMPLFFIASGWFFSEKYIDHPKDFVKRKIKGIYWPYLKWSILFLLLHNVFYSLGIINETYSHQNAYGLTQCMNKLLNVTFLMRDYDSLVATYWFMRALFVGCLSLCLVSYLIHKLFRWEKRLSILFTMVLFAVVGLVVSLFQLHIPVIPHNGYRELMAAFFVGMGFCLRKSIDAISRYVLMAIIILALCILIHPTEMFQDMSFNDWWVMSVSGTCGFLLIYQISKSISSKRGLISHFLTYTGQRTFYIMTFHFLMFKPASLLKAYINNLDWHVVGYLPVMPPGDDTWFWVVYVVISLALSLILERVVLHIPSPESILRRHNGVTANDCKECQK